MNLNGQGEAAQLHKALGTTGAGAGIPPLAVPPEGPPRRGQAVPHTVPAEIPATAARRSPPR